MQKIGISLALAVIAAAAPSSVPAHDMDAPAPQVMPSDDTRFVAYGQPVIALVHAEIIDGTGGRPKYDQTLIIENGRIAAIGPSSRLTPPPSATILEARGKTLIPGFVMMHEHMFYYMGRRDYGSLLYSFPRLYLAGGTTTARTGGSVNPYGDLELKRAIDRGEAIGPDLDMTGPYLNGRGFPVMTVHVMTDIADVTRTVNYWAEEGATSFKAYTNLSLAQLKAAVIAAHRHGLKITAHLCSITYREAAEAGIDNLEHGFAVMTDFVGDKQPDVCPPRSAVFLADLDINSPQVKELIDLLIAKRVALTSTLPVFETFTPGRPRVPERALSMLIPQLRVAYDNRQREIQTDPKAQYWVSVFPKLLKLEKMFADAGGVLLAGTDPTGYGGVIPGFAGKRQVQLLVEAGFSFPEALKIATLNGARYLKRDREVGSLVEGKRADLAVIDGDPMQDATAIERMPVVFKNGVGYSTDAIFEAIKGTAGLY